jgi:hypothetical protein
MWPIAAVFGDPAIEDALELFHPRGKKARYFPIERPVPD